MTTYGSSDLESVAVCDACRGEIVRRFMLSSPKPVTEFTKTQRRFAHMTEEQMAKLQDDVNINYDHIARLCK